jgi:ribosomal protein L15
VKVLADGDISHALVVKTHKISEAAREKLVAAGGQVEVLPA